MKIKKNVKLVIDRESIRDDLGVIRFEGVYRNKPFELVFHPEMGTEIKYAMTLLSIVGSLIIDSLEFDKHCRSWVGVTRAGRCYVRFA